MTTIEKYKVNWEHLDVNKFTENHLKHFTLSDIKNMFQREKRPLVPELAYFSFLVNGPWRLDFNFKRGAGRVLMQLHLPLFEGEGLSWKIKKLNPNKIWATEDSLDFDKLEMIKAAIHYMKKYNKPIPPVIVWRIKTESKYNLVCHDGHHRIYIYSKLGEKIPTVELEYWIDNREDPLLPKKLLYHKIDCYVKDMIVEKRDFISY